MYEQQRSGLGREFRTATERTLSWIAERPLAYPEILGRWRRALVPKSIQHYLSAGRRYDLRPCLLSHAPESTALEEADIVGRHQSGFPCLEFVAIV